MSESGKEGIARQHASEGEGERTKVLILIKGLGLGGAERLLVDAIPFLDRAHFDYHVGYLLPWKRFLVRELEYAGIPVHCLGGEFIDDGRAGQGFGPWATVRMLPQALQRLLALQRQHRFDLIQADLPIAGILARLVGRQSSVPVVYVEHNLQERYHPLTRWANATTYSLNQLVVAVSSEVTASIERFGLRQRTRVVTLPNGVPVELVRSEAAQDGLLRAELNIPADHLVVGTVAVFRSQKRLDDWLLVAARVAANRSNVTFLLVGGGPMESSVRARIEALGLTHCVRTPGFRPDGRRLMSVMDVYLMTSQYEGLPIALLEAMALGKPVVSTPVGGIEGVVESGVTGLLAPVGSIAELSQCVVRLLNDPALRTRMGRLGAVKVEAEHHAKHRVRAIENLYHEVLQGSG